MDQSRIGRAALIVAIALFAGGLGCGKDKKKVSSADPGGDPASSGPAVVCGDGAVGGAEQCDTGGESATCNADCTAAACGDGTVNATAAEACDDGNLVPLDGCSDACVVEAGFTCAGQPSSCSSVCGDAVLASDEECDDANAVDGDGCDSNCRVTGCGNGVVTDAEQCDDGNVEAGDGCDASCIYELHSGWVTIAAGSFSMGNALATDEQPAHDVAIPEFDVMLNEVTVSEFQSCVTAGSCTAPSSGAACNWGVSGRGNHPVNCVDWDRASAYCTWAGGRLPSEAEWEYAARGGQAVTFPWGEEAPTCGYVVMSEGGLGCGRRGTWPVCAKSAGNSAHGLCDMSGNVWEWVQDLQHDDYTGAPTDGSAWETGDETERVIRGGSWGNAADQLSVTRRGHAQPDIAVDSLGFRCARASASGR